MKKILSTMLIVVMAVLMLGSVSMATTKEDLKNYMLTEKGIGGTTYIINSEDRVKVERYLDTHDVTDAQAGEIKGLIDQAIDYMNKNGVNNPDKLSSTEKKKELLSYAQKAAAVLGLTVSYDASEGRLDIFENGTKIESLRWGLLEKTSEGKRSALAQTGSTNYVYAIAAGAVVIAVIALVALRKNNK